MFAECSHGLRGNRHPAHHENRRYLGVPGQSDAHRICCHSGNFAICTRCVRCYLIFSPTNNPIRRLRTWESVGPETARPPGMETGRPWSQKTDHGVETVVWVPSLPRAGIANEVQTRAGSFFFQELRIGPLPHGYNFSCVHTHFASEKNHDTHFLLR